MKLLFSLIAILSITFSSFSQDALFIKYETSIDASGDEGQMMAMMMNGSTMELAVSEKRTWVQTSMGTMMTMTMEMDVENDQMTMLMSGMMGNMAFQGSPDELDDEDEATEQDITVELVNERKKIMGYNCKKAVIIDADGNEAIYWYTEKFKRPDNVSQMPNQIPGLCLEMEISPQEGVSMTYTAIEVKEDINIDDYKLIIPEGVEIQSFEEMEAMGAGM